ncbi:MAG: hypothetical protein M3O30_17555 [Planctomycetota bacterium]|nr:hypothetical protein [Planctomycetota bacterium]
MSEIVEQATKPTLDPNAMKKICGGKFKHLGAVLVMLAERAEESNAATASAKFGFVKDGEPIEGRYVPEVTVTVKEPGED